MQIDDFLSRLVWLDGRPLMSVVEPYRRRIFQQFFSRDEQGRLRYNLGLFGRAKKNWKTTDLVSAALFALVSDSPTLAHETTHWTAHESRLARDFGTKRFGSEGYAIEELVAELGAAFLVPILI